MASKSIEAFTQNKDKITSILFMGILSKRKTIFVEGYDDNALYSSLAPNSNVITCENKKRVIAVKDLLKKTSMRTFKKSMFIVDRDHNTTNDLELCYTDGHSLENYFYMEPTLIQLSAKHHGNYKPNSFKDFIPSNEIGRLGYLSTGHDDNHLYEKSSHNSEGVKTDFSQYIGDFNVNTCRGKSLGKVVSISDIKKIINCEEKIDKLKVSNAIKFCDYALIKNILSFDISI